MTHKKHDLKYLVLARFVLRIFLPRIVLSIVLSIALSVVFSILLKLFCDVVNVRKQEEIKTSRHTVGPKNASPRNANFFRLDYHESLDETPYLGGSRKNSREIVTKLKGR